MFQTGKVKFDSLKDTFAAIEYIALLPVSALSLYNYEKIKDRLIYIFGNDKGRTIWIDSNIHIHCAGCVIIFLAALWTLHKQYAVLYCLLLTTLYVVFLWSNRSIALAAKLAYGQLSTPTLKMKYFALLNLMTTGARKENIPALYGYGLLFLVALLFFVFAKFVIKDNAFLPLLSAYVAGAATLHFAISVISFTDLMSFSDTENIEPWVQFLRRVTLNKRQIENVADWHHTEVESIAPGIQTRGRLAIGLSWVPMFGVAYFFDWPM